MIKHKIDPDGTEIWYRYNKYYNKNAPAEISSNGTEYWWLSGMVHRTSGPAIIWPNGTEEWYKLDSLTRFISANRN